jgi:hypothetical protein
MTIQSNEIMKNTKPPKKNLTAWRKQNRFRLQVVALAAALASPFGIYWALGSDQTWLAGVFFLVLSLSMAVTAWAG